jgi:hypothetical protein
MRRKRRPDKVSENRSGSQNPESFRKKSALETRARARTTLRISGSSSLEGCVAWSANERARPSTRVQFPHLRDKSAPPGRLMVPIRGSDCFNHRMIFTRTVITSPFAYVPLPAPSTGHESSRGKVSMHRTKTTLINVGSVVTLFAAAAVAHAQSAPIAVCGDSSLIWKGITLCGIVDIGVRYQTHRARVSDYFPSETYSVVNEFDYTSVAGVRPNNTSQSRMGIISALFVHAEQESLPWLTK